MRGSLWGFVFPLYSLAEPGLQSSAMLCSSLSSSGICSQTISSNAYIQLEETHRSFFFVFFFSVLFCFLRQFSRCSWGCPAIYYIACMLASNSGSACLSFPAAGITGLAHYAWLHRDFKNPILFIYMCVVWMLTYICKHALIAGGS